MQLFQIALAAVLLLAQLAYCEKPREEGTFAFYCSLSPDGELTVDKTYHGNATDFLGEKLENEVIKKVIVDILKGPGNFDGVVVVLRKANMDLRGMDQFVRELFEGAETSSFVFFPVKKDSLVRRGGVLRKIPLQHRPRQAERATMCKSE